MKVELTILCSVASAIVGTVLGVVTARQRIKDQNITSGYQQGVIATKLEGIDTAIKELKQSISAMQKTMHTDVAEAIERHERVYHGQ